jgi:Family of unknown function (DUF6526)
MEEQSYAKHAKFVPLFHAGLFGIIVVALLGSLYSLYRSMGNGHGRLDAVLLTLLSLAAFLLFMFCRTFPLKVQDRVIRAEENMRHFAMTGKLLDPRLTIKQIIGLRFASDAEFPALAQRAADESMSQDAIKRAVKNWRADLNRM